MDVKSKIESKTQELIGYAERIKNGEIGIYKDVAQSLKQIHILNALAVRNVKKPTDLSYSDLGLIGTILKKQYYQGKDNQTNKKFGLKWLFKDVQEKDLSISMIQHRLNLYAQSGGITKNTIELRKEYGNGKNEKRRLLTAEHQHCEDCLNYSRLGWVSILSDNLPLPMVDCECKTNCKCIMEYQ